MHLVSICLYIISVVSFRLLSDGKAPRKYWQGAFFLRRILFTFIHDTTFIVSQAYGLATLHVCNALLYDSRIDPRTRITRLTLLDHLIQSGFSETFMRMLMLISTSVRNSLHCLRQAEKTIKNVMNGYVYTRLPWTRRRRAH